MNKFDNLIKRTAEYHEAVVNIFTEIDLLDDPRCVAAFPSVYLSMEHAVGARTLISLGLNSSAYILYRPQFETLVRGMWLLYSAYDSYIEELASEMTRERELKPKKHVNLSLMLKQLEQSDAPKHIIGQLIEFRDITMKELNSFVHGGNVPMVMAFTAYPPELSYNVLLNSNALVAIAVQLAVNLSDDDSRIESVKVLHENFSDCINIIT